MICTFGHENLWSCSIVDLFPSIGAHNHSAYFTGEFDRSKVLYEE